MPLKENEFSQLTFIFLYFLFEEDFYLLDGKEYSFRLGKDIIPILKFTEFRLEREHNMRG